jgi:hypothetical protein
MWLRSVLMYMESRWASLCCRGRRPKPEDLYLSEGELLYGLACLVLFFPRPPGIAQQPYYLF